MTSEQRPEDVAAPVGDPPIPLAAPDGRVYAYACPRCHQVPAGASSLAQHDGPDPTLVEFSRNHADACCRCSRCRKINSDRGRTQCAECKPIVEAEQAERNREWTEREARRKVHNDLLLSKSPDAGAAMLLLERMREHSEECWCAGWLTGLEWSLWELARDGGGPFGQGDFTPDDAAYLRDLSDRAGGWWRWDDDLCGEVFVPIKEWRPMAERSGSS